MASRSSSFSKSLLARCFNLSGMESSSFYLSSTVAFKINKSTELIAASNLSVSFLFILLLFRGFFVIGCLSLFLEEPFPVAFLRPLFLGAAMTETHAVSNKEHVQQQISSGLCAIGVNIDTILCYTR